MKPIITITVTDPSTHHLAACVNVEKLPEGYRFTYQVRGSLTEALDMMVEDGFYHKSAPTFTSYLAGDPSKLDFPGC